MLLSHLKKIKWSIIFIYKYLPFRPLESVEIIWKKDGQELALSGLSHLLSYWNRTLTLLNVATMHAGMYECEVSMHEDRETKVTASANVTVIGKIIEFSF